MKSIIASIEDPRLFGKLDAFRDGLESWSAWLTFLRVIYGLPLDVEGLALFQEATGRTTPKADGYRETLLLSGVQSGKSRIAALIAAYEAIHAEPGTMALMLAQNHRSSLRVLLKYAREPFLTIPALKNEVVRDTSDLIELRGGQLLAAYPADPASVRGVRASVVLIDELSFFETSEGSPNDHEMLTVARGRTAMTGAKIISLTSPYARDGAVWDLFSKNFGVESSGVLVWKLPAYRMNPRLPEGYLRLMKVADPVAYASEVDGEFRVGRSNLLDPAVIQSCVPIGVRERPPVEWGLEYVAFVDVSGGSGSDAFTLGFAHLEGERVILDAIFAWRPPFNPASVVEECAVQLRRYRLAEVVGDAYGAGLVVQMFKDNHIRYTHSEWDRSTIYMKALIAINSGCVVLLDHSELLRELRGLERRRGTQGRDRVDHGRAGHDDLANSALGAVVLAGQLKHRRFTGEWDMQSQTPVNGIWQGLEYRNSEPWNGVCAPDFDAKGRPLNRPALFREGKIVAYL